MNNRKIVVTDSELELSHGLDEGCTLNVTDCATELRKESAFIHIASRMNKDIRKSGETRGNQIQLRMSG
jgi:hypothetical protein